MEKKAGEVYRIIRNKTGKCYVGQTTRTAAERFEEHRRCKTSYIGRAIRHYGVKAFTLEVLEVCETLEQLKERERYFIAKFDCRWPKGYNMTDGGEGIWDRTPESIKKMSRKGTRHTTTSRKQIALSLTGENNTRYGIPLSDETKNKLSQAAPNKRAVICVETNETFESITAAARNKELRLQDVSRACRNPGRTAGGFHWRYKDASTAENPASSSKKRPVICVETNETFESIRAASRSQQIGQKYISKACKDSSLTAGGYHWRFKDEQPTEPQSSAMTPAGTRTPKRPVVCVETNEVFESISAAARRKNLRVTNISRACQTQRNTAGGFHWRYKDEPTT